MLFYSERVKETRQLTPPSSDTESNWKQQKVSLPMLDFIEKKLIPSETKTQRMKNVVVDLEVGPKAIPVKLTPPSSIIPSQLSSTALPTSDLPSDLLTQTLSTQSLNDTSPSLNCELSPPPESVETLKRAITSTNDKWNVSAVPKGEASYTSFQGGWTVTKISDTLPTATRSAFLTKSSTKSPTENQIYGSQGKILALYSPSTIV